MSIIKSCAGAFDLFEDIRRLRGSDRWFEFIVLPAHVVIDGRSEFLHISKGTPPEAMLGQIAKEVLQHVQAAVESFPCHTTVRIGPYTQRFGGLSYRALHIQIWTALIAILVLKYMHCEKPTAGLCPT